MPDAEPDAAKWRRWTRLQVVAWIAFRDHRAVRLAAKAESETPDRLRPSDPYVFLVTTAALGDVRRKGGSGEPGALVVEAITRLETAEQAGNPVPDNSGRFRVAEIKKLFPSKEGRGKGQRPRESIAYKKIILLGLFFLTNRKDPTNPKHSWDGVLTWCRNEGLLRTRKQYEKLRPKALKFAEKELELRWRADSSIADYKKPLSHEEYEQRQANLKSWQRRGRPAKGA